jgi:hypothetical protein
MDIKKLKDKKLYSKETKVARIHEASNIFLWRLLKIAKEISLRTLIKQRN